MPIQLEALGLDKLSMQERLDLIEVLWDSLPEKLDASMIPDWHVAELAKRRAKESRRNNFPICGCHAFAAHVQTQGTFGSHRESMSPSRGRHAFGV